MEVEGVPGESTDDKHKDWIELLSASHGVSGPPAGAGERSKHRDVTVVKELDRTTPRLHLLCCQGAHIPKVTIEICSPTGSKQKIMEYIFEDVVVTAVGGVQGVSFSYGKITWNYIVTDPETGEAKGNVETYWDVTANKGG
jgi:type VI secretion system secreted protein Hcp